MKRRTFILGGGALATLSLAATATNASLSNGVESVADFRVLVDFSFRYKWEQNLEDAWNANDGTGYGNIKYQNDGKLGTYAIDFDGNDDYVDSGVKTELAEPFTVTYWIKTSENNPSAGHFWSTYDGSGGAYIQFINGGSANFTLRDDPDSIRVTTNDPINDGTYRLFTFVWDGSTLKGDLNDAMSQGSDTLNVSSQVNETLKFAGWGTSGKPTSVDGHPDYTGDAPRLYFKPLTPIEIHNLYHTGDINSEPPVKLLRYNWERSLEDTWNDNDGTGYGGISYTNKKDAAVGKNAINFDGTDDYVDSEVKVNLGTPFSIAYWIKTSDNNPSAGHFWSTYDGSGGAYLQFRSGGEINFIIRDDPDFARVTTNNAINDGTYRLFTFVWDGSTMEAYVNDANSQGTATLDASPQLNETVTFAGWGDGSDPATVDGHTDHFGDDPRLYNKALTATEVSNLYNTGSIN